MNVTGHCPRHEVDLYVYKRMASQTTVSFCSANVILCIHISNIMITSIYDRRLRFFISGVLMILITITACYACKFPLRLLQYHEFWIICLMNHSLLNHLQPLFTTTVRNLQFNIILILMGHMASSSTPSTAIARSNAELVENAVIVLYLVDIDEQASQYISQIVKPNPV